VSAQGDRVYFASGRDLSGVQTRNLEPLAAVQFDAPIHALAATPSGDRFYASLEGEATLSVLDRYSNAVAASIELPSVPTDLRVDPLGRYVLARAARGDSAWVVAVGTDRVVGSIRTAWRNDLPLVLPDGAILTALGNDVVMLDGSTLAPRRTIAGGAGDLWHLVMWNGFRPRAAGLDKPVEFQTDAPPRADSLADSLAADSAAVPTDTTRRAPPPDTVIPPRPAPRPGIAEAEAAVPSARGYTVQFAAAGSEREARAAIRRIKLAPGLTPRIVPTMRNGKTLYRVVVGPFASRAQADRVGRASGHDYWLYEGAP
jgi:cell division septation protein DedD